MLPPAVPPRRRRATVPPDDRTSTAVLLGAGLVLGLVGGWVAGLVRVRRP